MSTAVVSGLIGAAIATFLASYYGNRPSEISPKSGRRRLYYALGFRAAVDFVVVFLLLATIRVIVRQPDDTAIFVSSIWRKNREIPWHDFKSISQQAFFSMHTIETKTNGKVRIYDMMAGSSKLVEHARWQERNK